MPKRSAQDQLEYYERKIRKIKEKEAAEKRRRRILRPLDSSSEDENHAGDENQIVHEAEIHAQPERAETHDIPAPVEPSEPLAHDNPAVQESSPTEQIETVHQEYPSVQDTAAPASSDTATEIALDPELLSALGASTSLTPEFGENIHDTLSNLWTPLLKKGLPKEEREKLLKEHLIPANCKLLQSPKLNAEISAAISEISRGRDKKLTGFQQQLGSGTTAVSKAMDVLLKSDNKILALKHLSESCRILSDLHYNLTKDRVKLITPSLDKNFTHMIQDSERDETLFGNSLSEKIKASKAIERQGLQIKKPVSTQKSNTPQTSVTRPTNQGNWSGPPRYSSNRGGRGGYSYRRPAVTTPRRNYLPAQAASAKNSNPTKTRAPTQQ